MVVNRRYLGMLSRAQGQHFEERIDYSLAYYRSAGLAVIEKTPEPMRPIKSLGNGRFVAHYAKAAQPDYKGVLKELRRFRFQPKALGFKGVIADCSERSGFFHRNAGNGPCGKRNAEPYQQQKNQIQQDFRSEAIRQIGSSKQP